MFIFQSTYVCVCRSYSVLAIEAFNSSHSDLDQIRGRKQQQERNNNNKNWWVELTVDGIHPRSASIDWDPGDPVQQGVLVGADLVSDFRPLAKPVDLASVLTTEPISAFPQLNATVNGNPLVIRSGFVGECLIVL